MNSSAPFYWAHFKLKDQCGCPCQCAIIPNLPSSDTTIRCLINRQSRNRVNLRVRPPHCCLPTSGWDSPQSGWSSPWPSSPPWPTWWSWPSTRRSWWPGGRRPSCWRSTWAPPATASLRLSGSGTWPGTTTRSERTTWWWLVRATCSSRLASSWSHWKGTSERGYTGLKPRCMEVSQTRAVSPTSAFFQGKHSPWPSPRWQRKTGGFYWTGARPVWRSWKSSPATPRWRPSRTGPRRLTARTGSLTRTSSQPGCSNSTSAHFLSHTR